MAGAKVGRPRSKKAYLAILKAAREIIEEAGTHRLTIEGVARRAGVGKPTIYRYWSNAQELAIATFMNPEVSNLPETSTNPGISDLRNLIQQTVQRLNSKQGRQMAFMLAGAETDSELFKAFRNRMILDTREKGTLILESAKIRGEIRSDVDVGLCLDMILGMIVLRLLIAHTELGEDLVDDVISMVLKGILPGASDT
ncbi:TetR/AcrR family transcriptional regulator [Sneathiella marina]|uniref:TetR/AcrR family transcriptional regulator n=1 Tax=Sneathiella marina TaxID=2950108 RepID=A0ABY4VZG2_9PROT|nr:TetR/AcrR family transcriptional regulator [Sneathiella marina]USG60228.1 TetR/AcrR family transcriptional regulator [Sneathiella marina]